MSLKITGGDFKGRTISSPSHLARPTSSIMRQAFFNMIQHEIEDSFFLDLYAGSGIMGIEALSRKAAYAVFIEKSKKGAFVVKKNLERLKITQAKIICADVCYALANLINSSFDIVFMDPPYKDAQKLVPLTFSHLSESLLHSKAQVFVEQRYEPEKKASTFSHFQYIKSKKHGNSLLHQYQYLH